MLKIIYIKNPSTNRYEKKRTVDWHPIREFLEEKDFPLETFATIFLEGGVDSYLKSLKSYPAGYTGEFYEVTDWGKDLYILGSPWNFLKGLREKDNKKIAVNKKEFINLLELWVKLTFANAEEIVLEREDDVISLSGNGEKAKVHWSDFKYDWEDEDEEVYP